MSNNDQTQKASRPTEQKMTPKELFDVIISQWRWILLSLTICIGLAVFFLAWKQESYTRTTQVEIKDENDSGASSALAMFSDLGIGQGTNNLYNEMAYFESPDLIAKVVKRLGLQTNYMMKKGLRSTVLYGSSCPVKVDFLSLSDNAGGSFRMKIDENENIFLDKFVLKDEKLNFDQKAPFKFGQTVMTPLGKIKIEKTPYFGKDKEEEDDKSYKIGVFHSSIYGAVESWLNKLTVDELRKEASIAELSIVDGSPRRAEDFLNTMIEIYNEDWVENKNKVALASSEFIEQRLQSLSKELEEVDSDISDYKSSNQIPDLVASATLDLSEDQVARKEMMELNNQLQMAKYLKDYVESPDADDKVLPVNSGVSSPTLDAQIANYNTMVLNRNSVLSNSSAENPVVQTLNSHIADLRKVVISSIDNQIQFLNGQIKNLSKEKGRIEKNISANPEQTRFLLGIGRQQTVKETLYIYLLQKREENQLNQAFVAYNTRIIASPHGDQERTSPNSKAVLALAIFMGLAMPIGFFYVRAVSNTKVRDRKDLKGLTMPFLGEIPKVNRKKYDDKDHMLVVSPGNRNVVNEAFRVARTNLNFMLSEDEKCPVVMVTSFNPGSGKSFVTVNLAMSLAIRGKRVLVIDGDMRRNSSSAYVGDPEVGFAQVLMGKIKNVDEVVVKGKLHENLDILPGGKTPPNPTELLENGRLAPMVEQLRQEYDVIFIDNAPIQMIADGRIFSTVCTNTIFVIRAGLFERGLLSELENVYRSKEYKSMSLLLNGTAVGGSYGSYGSYYGGKKNYYASND